MSEVVEAIKELKTSIDTTIREKSLTVESVRGLTDAINKKCPTSLRMLGSLEYPECLFAIAILGDIAMDYDPAKISAEDFIELRLIKLERDIRATKQG
jgi:hypothetical protein